MFQGFKSSVTNIASLQTYFRSCPSRRIKAISCEITALCVCVCVCVRVRARAECLVFNAERNAAERRQSPIAVRHLVSSALRRAVPR